jgi:hypothetical protein
MGQHERGAGDVPDFAGTGGDVVEDTPAAGEQSEPAFAQAAQGPLEGLASAGVDIELLSLCWLSGRDVDADAAPS